MIPPAAQGPVNKPTGYENTVDALKVGLRAHYAKKPAHQQLNETTLQPQVGAELPQRALGAPANKRYFQKGGTSLRKDIQDLEKALEKTLLGLSNKGLRESDVNEFKMMLADSIKKAINGDRSGIRETMMQATMLESQQFIAPPAPETPEILTPQRDIGNIFRAKIQTENPMVEMIANQLSSGTPMQIVINNISAAYASTANASARTTLEEAHRILSEMM